MPRWTCWPLSSSQGAHSGAACTPLSPAPHHGQHLAAALTWPLLPRRPGAVPTLTLPGREGLSRRHFRFRMARQIAPPSRVSLLAPQSIRGHPNSASPPCAMRLRFPFKLGRFRVGPLRGADLGPRLSCLDSDDSGSIFFFPVFSFHLLSFETLQTVSRVRVESDNVTSCPSVEMLAWPATVMGVVRALHVKLVPRCLWPRGRDLDGPSAWPPPGPARWLCPRPSEAPPDSSFA